VLDPYGVPISEEPTNWQQIPDVAVLISGGVFYETGPTFQSGGGDSNVVFLMYEYTRPSTGSHRTKQRRIRY
jgi:hypothetical protein